MPIRSPNAFLPTTWWILLCAFCSVAGWVLSALHQLNAAGYTVSFLFGLAAALVLRVKTGRRSFVWPPKARLRRRFRRPIPAAFLVLTVLAFLGGALYAPNNYDALAYRVPRVLHWLAEGRWHWIHTQFQRINVRGCGFEWMMAPLILFTRTDRSFFLVNFISFCLLPGLFFSNLRRLGVSPRVAWSWMWILPSGYCYLLQAGSLGNDLFGGFFAVAAIGYGLRARQEHRLSDFWLSALAMALATGVKANNLPFLAAWTVTVAPCWRLLRAKLLGTVGVATAALVVSFLPMALANAKYGGDWTGAVPEGLVFRAPNPLMRLSGNLGLLLLHNLTPPLAPFAHAWNTRIASRLETRSVSEAFGTSSDDLFFTMREMATEESAGLGLGICVLLAVSVWAACRDSGEAQKNQPRNLSLQGWVLAGAAIGTGAVLAISGAKSGARFLDGYYLFLVFPLLLCRGQARVVRTRWWPGAAVAVALMASVPLVLSPARPLFPIQTALRGLRGLGWSGPLMTRVQTVVSVYAERADSFAPALELIPPEVKVLGYVSFDDPEAALWKPFGTRNIIHVCPEDTAAALRAKGVQYILFHDRVADRFPMPFNEWLIQLNAEVVRPVPLTLRAGRGQEMWHLIRLR